MPQGLGADMKTVREGFPLWLKVAVAALLASGVAACAQTGTAEPVEDPHVTLARPDAELPASSGTLGDLKEQFNEDTGSPRLLLLVSPT